jgi:hypothetical protein
MFPDACFCVEHFLVLVCGTRAPKFLHVVRATIKSGEKGNLYKNDVKTEAGRASEDGWAV